MANAIGFDPELSDVLNDGYVSAKKTVGLTEILAAVGGSNQSGRELLYLENTGTTKLYYGPTGVTTTGSTKGSYLAKGQFIFLPVGAYVSVYIISDGASGSAVIQEYA
jgi:hypothetical protein